MEAGFFLNITDNTGDGLLYETLPVNTVNKNPKHNNPVTLTSSVLRSRMIYSPDAPMCVESKIGFKFYNTLKEQPNSTPFGETLTS